MAEYLIQSETLDDIADAINAKTGGSSAMTPAQMATAIGSISGGGGGNTPVEVTIVSGVENASITLILNAILSASGKSNFYAVRKDTPTESGYFLYGGIHIPDMPNYVPAFSLTFRRASNGGVAAGQWSAIGTVPAGAKFDVWSVADYD